MSVFTGQGQNDIIILFITIGDIWSVINLF